MNDAILLFRGYTVFLLLFLVPLSYFVSVELFHLIELTLLYLRFGIFTKKLALDQNNGAILFNFYCRRKKWLLSISLMELFSVLNLMNSSLAFGSLAYLYMQLSYWDIAEYYYLKAVSCSPYDVNALSNLANMYNILKKEEKALDVYRQIFLLDNNYSVPKKYSLYF